jgi:3-dehydroquinate dehydratase-1
VDAIDLELATLRFMDPVLELARDYKRGLILSAHSITRKLTTRKINRLLKTFRIYKANVYKIAGLGRTQKDLGVLAKALIDHPEFPLAIMAIGSMADASRVVLPALGSRLVYGYLDEPASKNQPSIQEVSDRLDFMEI